MIYYGFLKKRNKNRCKCIVFKIKKQELIVKLLIDNVSDIDIVLASNNKTRQVLKTCRLCCLGRADS